MQLASSSPPIRRTLLAALLAMLILPITLQGGASAQEPTRVGVNSDPVLAAIEISQAKTSIPGEPTTHELVVLGRSDLFPDNLAATALAGTRGTVLYTDGGADATLRPEVLTELDRSLVPGTCTDGEGPTVYVAGGVDAVSQAVEDELRAGRFCVERLDGLSRFETAVATADAVVEPSGMVLLARSDSYADAASIGSYAALTGSRILVTPPDGLHPATAAALDRMNPEQIVLLGGTAALSDAVADEAVRFGPVRRVFGPTRDNTAVAFARLLWTDEGPAARGDGVALANGFEETDWTYLFAGASYAGQLRQPFLYLNEGERTPATRSYLATNAVTDITQFGPQTPDQPPTADLGSVRIRLETIATGSEPLMIKPLPNSQELWIIEKRGTIKALTPAGERTVLDISSTVSSGGERGLLGFAFNPEGTRLYTSSTNGAGNSVIDEFEISDGVVDAGTRREVIQVGQPASNHNGGDLVWGPDNYLYWSLGDGGASDDRFGNGQNTATLLGGIVRIDVTGGQPYTVPADNPFAAGGGAPELWAYGLRNPFRIAFDDATGDLYIGDVGQDEVEEIDYAAAGTGAGRNYGWPVFEGDRPFSNGSIEDHTPPVLVEDQDDGNCSITGGVVYRGDGIPGLNGAYLYSDYCRNSIRALAITDGLVTQRVDFGVVPDGGSPVGFGVDHGGEVYVLSQSGAIQKLTAS